MNNNYDVNYGGVRVKFPAEGLADVTPEGSTADLVNHLMNIFQGPPGVADLSKIRGLQKLQPKQQKGGGGSPLDMLFNPGGRSGDTSGGLGSPATQEPGLI
jgi:hypothetical protein